MASFDDMLRGANDRMDFDPYLCPVDPQRDWCLTFKAQPKKTVGMEFQKLWQTAWKDGEIDPSKPAEKTTSKLKLNHGDCNTTWTFSNEKFAMQGVGKLLTGDYKVNLSGTAEAKYLKSAWKLVGLATLSTPDLGGAKINSSLEFEHESTGAQKLKPKINFELQEEINVGLSGEHDTKDLQKGLFQVVYSPKDQGRFWMRGNVKSQEFGAGCDNKVNDNIEHSFEATYNWGGAEGIKGTNFGLRGGVDYSLSDQTSLTAAASWGKDVNVNQTVEHKCDKNWTVSATQSFDQELVGTKQGAYHIGFAATYKL
jgi:hypothetical protein